MAKALYGSRKKYHYLYRTENLKNGKFYYGMHSTDDLEDGYIGSGTYLRRAINKHGKENFKIEILEFFDSREELVRAEKDLITEQMTKDQNCYNLKQGGIGGFTRDQAKKGRQITNKICEAKYGPNWRRVVYDRWRGSLSTQDLEMYSNRIKEGQKRAGVNHATFKGKKHSEETKKKMSESSKGKSKGDRNSQYGTCWITDGKVNKKIKKGDNIPEGFTLGRIIKKEKNYEAK